MGKKKTEEQPKEWSSDRELLDAILAAYDHMKTAEDLMDKAAEKKLTPKAALEKLEQSITDSEEVTDTNERLDAILGAYRENIVEREETYNEWRKAQSYYVEKKEAFEQYFIDAKQETLPFEEDSDA